MDSFEALKEFWIPRYGVDIGISDSALSLQTGRILDELKPRTLVIIRPVQDYVASLVKYATGNKIKFSEEWCREFGERSAASLAAIKSHPLVKTVKYSALDDFSVMEACMKWVLPNAEFPDLKPLMGMNIQVAVVEARRIANSEHNSWHLS